MTAVFDDLTEDIRVRQRLLRSDRNIHTMALRDMDPGELVAMSVGQVLKGAESKVTMVDLAVSLGQRIRQKLKLNRNSVAACHMGWFVLIAYFEHKLIGYYLKKKKKKGRTSKCQSYHISLLDSGRLKQLWETLHDRQEYVELFPMKSPPLPWTCGHHEMGFPMIRKGDSYVLSQINEEEDAFLLRVLNKLGAVGWRINNRVLDVYNHYLNNPPGPFRMHREEDPLKIQSLKIEAETIGMIANKMQHCVHYHLWSMDFRGRVYPLSSFLHPQGSDNAKGLLLFEEEKPLGTTGLFWLKVHIANSFGQDKLPYEERVTWVDDNSQVLLQIAEDPYGTVKEWGELEKPWSALACAFEWQSFVWHESDKPWVTSLPIFVDGSCSGVQHLSALARDEDIGSLVNLVPTDKPGDLYQRVATDVWKALEKMDSQVNKKFQGRLDEVLDREQKFKKDLEETSNKPEINTLIYKEYKEWINHNRSLREGVFPAFWLGIDDPKIQRKSVKRCVMVLGYGGTRYGFGQFLQEDLDDINEHIDKRSPLFCALMGSLIYDTCFESLDGPGRMLRLFEEIGELANERGEYLSWLTPVGFPVVQSYPKAASKRTKLSYGGREFNVVVESWEESTLAQSAQKQATAPNFIHSLDAAHLQLIIDNFDGPIAAIHDSVGCHPGAMHEMYHLIRESFLSLYATNPLEDFLKQVGYTKPVKRGELDLEQVRESKYFFS